MSRRSHEDEHENHERWLVSYADFITLLFAFFVVMYALSSVNEGKYRVLSDSLVNAFRNIPINASGHSMNAQSLAPPLPVQINPRRNARAEEAQRLARERARQVAGSVASALDPLVRAGMVRVSEGPKGITVEISSSVLFRSGDAALDPGVVPLLRNVGGVLGRSEFAITVEGHTDTTPISNAQFASNWELAAVRAATVVRLFVESGVLAQRLTASGYGEQRPLESNDSPEGRARNRRVAILIESLAPEAPVDPAAAPVDYTPSFPVR